jgi:exopolyphosphatase/guanosine-5'-triphosphate,3'-diphosphate pyrophosphatase
MSGAAILRSILRVWPTNTLTVADRGLREGILYSQMVKQGFLS